MITFNFDYFNKVYKLWQGKCNKPQPTTKTTKNGRQKGERENFLWEGAKRITGFTKRIFFNFSCAAHRAKTQRLALGIKLYIHMWKDIYSGNLIIGNAPF